MSESLTESGMRMREVAPRDGTDLRTVSALHMELLDFGPMAGLGEPFIRKACYLMHMRDGTLRCALCEIDGEPAGFVAYTSRGVSFHREGLRKHWLYAGMSLAESLLRDPRRFKALARALRVVASRRSESKQISDPLGEIVCIAVRPEFTKPSVKKRYGSSVTEMILRYTGDRLRAEGVDRMRALVDADNRAALMMYHLLGASFESYEQAGEPMVEAWMELP